MRWPGRSLSANTVNAREKTLSRGPHSCVLLADRHPGLVEGLRGLLETAFGTVVMVADKVSLQDVAFRLRPDVAVVDVSLVRDGGLGWLMEMRARCPGLKVIALSVHDEDAVRLAALKAGADEFVLKRAIGTELLPAVDRLLASTVGEPIAPTGETP
jgi:DNA-binding NarL/FixJ family response regulator